MHGYPKTTNLKKWAPRMVFIGMVHSCPVFLKDQKYTFPSARRTNQTNPKINNFFDSILTHL